MDIALYHKFQKLTGLGRKAEAKYAIVGFVESFADKRDIARWTWQFLASLTDEDSKIRHEIFEGLVFPVLLEGYEAGDPMCSYWLGRLSQNLYAAKHLHAKIGYELDVDLYRKAYLGLPDNKNIQWFLLKALLNQFDYYDHEWPSGLLFPEAATKDVLDAVELARKLDSTGAFEGRLNEFSDRVHLCASRSDG